MAERDALVFQVACPRCSAEVGHPCWTQRQVRHDHTLGGEVWGYCTDRLAASHAALEALRGARGRAPSRPPAS